MALALEAKGQSAESLEKAQKATKLPGMFSAAGSLAGIFCRLHRPDLAREILKQMDAAEKAGDYVAPLEFSMTQFALGDRVAGLALLRKAVNEHSYNIVLNIWDPVFDSVREDPEFADMMNEMRVPRACWHDMPRLPKHP